MGVGSVQGNGGVSTASGVSQVATTFTAASVANDAALGALGKKVSPEQMTVCLNHQTDYDSANASAPDVNRANLQDCLGHPMSASEFHAWNGGEDASSPPPAQPLKNKIIGNAYMLGMGALGAAENAVMGVADTVGKIL